MKIEIRSPFVVEHDPAIYKLIDTAKNELKAHHSLSKRVKRRVATYLTTTAEGLLNDRKEGSQ